jgi:hypothetical protein
MVAAQNGLTAARLVSQEEGPKLRMVRAAGRA